MKVYISVDMEGATGICSREQTSKNSPASYREGQELLTQDVNAAIEGALAGGATEITVADRHNGSFNLLPGKIHPAARVIYGYTGGEARFPGLDASVDSMFLVAYHARAGTLHGTLEHTMSSQHYHKVTLNGNEIGEIGIDAGIAGAFGVPVVLVTGDDKACAEARDLLGGIATAEVKDGLGRHQARCLAPEKTKSIIFEAARTALSLKDTIIPLVYDPPIEVAITYKHTEYADHDATLGINGKRIDGYTVVRQYADFLDWYGRVRPQ